MGGKSEAPVVQDVDMEAGDPTSSAAAGDDVEATKVNSDLVSAQEIRDHARQIEKAVNSKEPRFVLRVLRSLPNTRRKVNATVLRSLAAHLYPAGLERDSILAFVEPATIADAAATAPSSGEPAARPPRAVTKSPLPEVDAYIHLLALVRLIDAKELRLAGQCTETLMKKIVGHNRRTLDLIAAKSYFYHTRVAELNGTLEGIRSFLHARLRTATLRNDYEGMLGGTEALRLHIYQYSHPQAKRSSSIVCCATTCTTRCTTKPTSW